MKTPYYITLLSFVLFFAFWIWFWSILDAPLYLEGWWPHTWRWFVRALPVVLFVYASLTAGYLRNWKSALSLALIFAAWFWLSFDAKMNIMRGHEWYYLADTAFLDRVFSSFQWQFGAKLILLVGSLFWFVRSEMK